MNDTPLRLLAVVPPHDPLLAGLGSTGFVTDRVDSLRGVDISSGQPPRAVILDESMQQVTLADVQRLLPGAPVLILRDDLHGHDPPGVQSLRKPVSLATLLAALANALGGPGRADMQQLLDDVGRVLIVDPDANRAATLQEAIELEGLACGTVTSVSAACQWLLRERPDILLLTCDDQTAPLRAFVQQFGHDVPLVWLPPSLPPDDGAALPADIADNPAEIAKTLARVLDEAGP